MSDTTAAGRYARALFELAEKEKSLAKVDLELHALAEALETYPKIPLLMANPTLTDDAKYNLVQRLFPVDHSNLLERFMRVLIDKKRFAALPEIQKNFHVRFEKYQGVLEVEMVSAMPLSEKFLEKLSTVLAKKLHTSPPAASPGAQTKIRLIPLADRSLLGGFVLRFDGKEIDCSFKNRLYEIQQKLLSSIEEGIA